MAVKVRDYLEKYGYKVGYDNKTGDVLVTDTTGKTKNIGSAGFALGEDGRYYADSENTINNMLDSAGVKAGINHSGVRNSLNTAGNSVGWLDNGETKQLSVSGKRYNPNDGNFINIGGTLYAGNDYIKALADTDYKSPYSEKIERGLQNIQSNRFNYDPYNDAELKAAQKQAIEQVQQKLNSQGVLNSSLNALYSQQAAQALVPEYSRMAYDRYLDEQDAAYNYLAALMGLENESFDRWQNDMESEYKYNMLVEEQKAQSNAERAQRVADTVEKIRITGTVSNEDSLITGLPAGRVDREMMGRLDDLTGELILMEKEHQQNKEILGKEQEYTLEAMEQKFMQEQAMSKEEFEQWKRKNEYETANELYKKKMLREWEE